MSKEGSKCLVIERMLPDNDMPNNPYFNRPPSKLLGTVEFSPSDFLDTAFEHVGSSRKLYIADFGIHKDARRMGLATRLLNEIENYCKKYNYDELYLHVERDNEIGKNLYLKQGFVPLNNYNPSVSKFTVSRLQKPADGFIMFKKSLNSNDNVLINLNKLILVNPTVTPLPSLQTISVNNNNNNNNDSSLSSPTFNLYNTVVSTLLSSATELVSTLTSGISGNGGGGSNHTNWLSTNQTTVSSSSSSSHYLHMDLI